MIAIMHCGYLHLCNNTVSRLICFSFLAVMTPLNRFLCTSLEPQSQARPAPVFFNPRKAGMENASCINDWLGFGLARSMMPPFHFPPTGEGRKGKTNKKRNETVLNADLRI